MALETTDGPCLCSGLRLSGRIYVHGHPATTLDPTEREQCLALVLYFALVTAMHSSSFDLSAHESGPLGLVIRVLWCCPVYSSPPPSLHRPFLSLAAGSLSRLFAAIQRSFPLLSLFPRFLPFYLHLRLAPPHPAVTMIAGLSKATTLYLAPLLSLTSIFLMLFAFFAPIVLLHSQVSLLVVSPSAILTDPNSSHGIDGPTIFLGSLGSCSRTKNDGAVSCEAPTLSPKYDLSALPDNAPDLLSAPTATTPVFIAIAIVFAIFFFVLFTLISLRASLGAKLSAALDKPVFQRASAWIGLLGFMIGLTSFLVIRMWFGKAVEDFNQAISKGGASSPQLVASTSNGFTMVWVAYAFYGVPLVCALARLHVTATGGK